MVLSDGTQLGQSANANLLRDVKGMFNIISKLRHARLGEGEVAAAVVVAAAAAAAAPAIAVAGPAIAVAGPAIPVAGPAAAAPAEVAAPLAAAAAAQAVQVGDAPTFVDNTDSDGDFDDGDVIFNNVPGWGGDIIFVSDDE